MYFGDAVKNWGTSFGVGLKIRVEPFVWADFLFEFNYNICIVRFKLSTGDDSILAYVLDDKWSRHWLT